MKEKINKLTTLNSKLANGYELSLKIVVDVSKLLRNYTKMFDDIEKLLGTLDHDMGSHQLDIKYISELTKKSIDKIRMDFNSQYPSIIDALEKDGNRENVASAQKLKMIVNEISTDAKNVESEFKTERDLENMGIAKPRSGNATDNKNNSFFGGMKVPQKNSKDTGLVAMTRNPRGGNHRQTKKKLDHAFENALAHIHTDKKQKTENRKQNTENRKQKTENRKQNTENRKQKTENRKQKTENRKQKTENRK
jgi:hypothetical protein